MSIHEVPIARRTCGAQLTRCYVYPMPLSNTNSTLESLHNTTKNVWSVMSATKVANFCGIYSLIRKERKNEDSTGANKFLCWCHIRQTLTHENDALATKRKTLKLKILQLHATILRDVLSLVVVVVVVVCDEVVLLGRHADDLPCCCRRKRWSWSCRRLSRWSRK